MHSSCLDSINNLISQNCIEVMTPFLSLAQKQNKVRIIKKKKKGKSKVEDVIGQLIFLIDLNPIDFKDAINVEQFIKDIEQ